MKEPMSLEQLRDRLNEVIAENDRRGWSDRNQMPVLLRLMRRTPKGRLRSRFFTLNSVQGSCVRVGNQDFCPELNVEEASEIVVK